ncbi:hypothetical protein NLX86_30195 [Streptomyces sp. A3M-1-3]|uniref:hypothetical protein n=1 Tax=Streptomyces sp. A3M-1-3 TaxID=2962044 RepID=UPI0020B7A048|nr:hypothetical protein [Streptomyces sp. A3M-1-3]MCP3822207.1 hypothetical protein [Streptomyces sp. A3M-1-3]
MLTFRKTAVSFAALGCLLAGAGSAAADGGAPSPDAARAGDGAHALCKRVPKIDKRIDRALDRLNGNAAKRGSLAGLKKRVAAAEAAGHTEIHTLLNNRLTARKSLLTTLEQRRKDVSAVKTWCEANDNGSEH